MSRNAPLPLEEALTILWPLPWIHNPELKVPFIVFVDCWCNFIYLLFQLLVAMIYKGAMELLIADIELELMYSVVPFWSLAVFYSLDTAVPVEI